MENFNFIFRNNNHDVTTVTTSAVKRSECLRQLTKGTYYMNIECSGSYNVILTFPSHAASAQIGGLFKFVTENIVK